MQSCALRCVHAQLVGSRQSAMYSSYQRTTCRDTFGDAHCRYDGMFVCLSRHERAAQAVGEKAMMQLA
jgi:hypothetical protein